MKSEFTGNIVSVRAVEDSIRATRKYTEGIGTIRQVHPVQGGDFPSKTCGKYYEVYPYVDLDQKMPFGEAIGAALDWLWRDTPCIDVLFKYDYRANKASVLLKDGPEAVKELSQSIPGFREALDHVLNNDNGSKEQHP